MALSDIVRNLGISPGVMIKLIEHACVSLATLLRDVVNTYSSGRPSALQRLLSASKLRKPMMINKF